MNKNTAVEKTNVETTVKKRRGRPAGSLGFKKVLEMHAKGQPVDPAVFERARAKQKAHAAKLEKLRAVGDAKNQAEVDAAFATHPEDFRPANQPGDDKLVKILAPDLATRDPLAVAAASAEENLYGHAEDPADSVDTELEPETEQAMEMQSQDENRPRFPEVEVPLVGHDGNAFSIMGRVVRGLRAAGHGDYVDTFMKDAMSGNYDHLLQVAMKTVTVL